MADLESVLCLISHSSSRPVSVMTVTVDDINAAANATVNCGETNPKVYFALLKASIIYYILMQC